MDELTRIFMEETILASFPEGTKIKYFYTENTPHQYSSGKRIKYYTYTAGSMSEIISLEEAHKAALAKQSKVRGREDTVDCTFGIEIILPDERAF